MHLRPFYWIILASIIALHSVTAPLTTDNDLFLHLAKGRQTIETLTVQSTDSFTYTQMGQWDESQQSWLSQILFFGFYSLGGEYALRLLAFVLLSAMTGLLFHTFAKKSSLSDSFLFSLLFLALQFRFQLIRPFLLGELFFLLIFYGLIETKFTVHKVVWLFALSLLWANCHASVTILPLLVFSYGVANRSFSPRHIGLTTLAVTLGSLLTPMGVNLYRYAFSLGRFSSELGGEWTRFFPLFLSDTRPTVRLDIGSVLLLCYFLVLLFKKDRRRTLGFLPLVLLALSSSRHILFLAALFPVFEESIAPLLKRIGPWGTSIAALALFFAFQGHRTYDTLGSIANASTFLRQANIHGNIFNYHPFGSYLILANPESKVALDNRSLLHQDFFKALHVLQSEPVDTQKELLNRLPRKTDILFLSTKERPLYEILPREWAQVYENNHVSIAVRKGSPQWERAREYLIAKRIDLAKLENLTLRQAWEINPSWTLSQMEDSQQTLRTLPYFRHNYQMQQAAIYSARGLPSVPVPNHPPSQAVFRSLSRGMPTLALW